MSGYSEVIDCPKCGSKESLEHSCSYDYYTDICLECGYFFEEMVEEKRLSLKELNQKRKEFELEPLKRRKSYKN